MYRFNDVFSRDLSRTVTSISSGLSCRFLIVNVSIGVKFLSDLTTIREFREYHVFFFRYFDAQILPNDKEQ